MTFGGLLCGLAESYWTLWLGRLISGFGAIGINVAMSKIVIDWFAGKEINTAMAVFLSGFPVGIALALISLGHLATPDGWALAFHATSAFSFVALASSTGTKPMPMGSVNNSGEQRPQTPSPAGARRRPLGDLDTNQAQAARSLTHKQPTRGPGASPARVRSMLCKVTDPPTSPSPATGCGNDGSIVRLFNGRSHHRDGSVVTHANPRPRSLWSATGSAGRRA